MLEHDLVKLSEEEEIRFQNALGDSGEQASFAPLTSDESSRFAALLGASRSGEESANLSFDEELRFREVFGNVFAMNAKASEAKAPAGAIGKKGVLRVVCQDPNNNNAIVSGVDQLKVGTNCSGNDLGDIGMNGLGTISKDANGNLLVGALLSIDVLPSCPKESELPKGTVVEYKPHVSKLKDSGGRNPFYELVLAHEKGHASAFLSDFLPTFESKLLALGIPIWLPAGMIELLYGNAIRDAYSEAREKELIKIVLAANPATMAAFSSRWKRLSDSGIYYRWQKK